MSQVHNRRTAGVWPIRSLVGTITSLLLPCVAAATPYTYNNYSSMQTELSQLAADHPDLTELFSAQDRYGLPTVPDGATSYEHPILRITNEALGLDKAEVLIVGVQHGDEVVGLETSLALARLLLESYGVNPWITELVDRREIYIMPLANPFGHSRGQRSSPGSEGSEDMNRDHVYDRDDCSFFCFDEDSLSTVGARAIHELARRHLFRVVLDLHGGAEVILHPWGSPLHSSNTTSPDHEAAERLGDRMSAFAGPFSSTYPVGTAADLLGPVNGPLDDTAYAASWDAGNADPLWPTLGWRALSYTIEISNQKRPPSSTLGGDADLLNPGGTEDGYVPKTVRLALAGIDVAEPYLLWTNRAAIATTIGVGESVQARWEVRGCFEVDSTRLRWGNDPDPLNLFDDQSPVQSDTNGDPCFGNVREWSASVTFDQPGIYYLTPVARVDQALSNQDGSNPPGTAPQSWVVRARTEDGFFFQNSTDPGEVNTISGSLDWGTEPLRIEVIDSATRIFSDNFESGGLDSWSGKR